MRSFTAIALAVGALTIASSAQATEDECHTCELNPSIDNEQIARHLRVQSDVDVDVGSVAGDLEVSGTAVGNNLSYVASTNVNPINNVQKFGGVVESNVKLKSNYVGGSLNVSSTAVANNASLEFTGTPSVVNIQTARNDPSATAVVEVGEVHVDAEVNATAVANNLSITGVPDYISNVQHTSWAPVLASATVKIGSVGGNLTVAGTAVGNNISVKPTPVVH